MYIDFKLLESRGITVEVLPKGIHINATERMSEEAIDLIAHGAKQLHLDERDTENLLEHAAGLTIWSALRDVSTASEERVLKTRK